MALRQTVCYAGRMGSAATRYIASFIVEVFGDFLRFSVHQNDLTVEEVAIICLVAAESTREVRKNPFATRNFGGEDDVLPNDVRPSVPLKYIHTSLGMSRETTRRKVSALVERGFLRRSGAGVMFPAQDGDSDQTREIRLFLARKVDVLAEYLARLPD